MSPLLVTPPVATWVVNPATVIATPPVPTPTPPVVVPAILAIPRVLAAVRLVLMNDAQLVARLASAPTALGGGPAIYSEGAVPDAARPDYLTIGPFSERSEATMGSGRKWGSDLAMPIKLVTQNLDVGHSLATLDRLVALLHGVRLTVEDYSHGSCVLEVVVDAYAEKYAGIVTLHYPTVWTIHVGQPT